MFSKNILFIIALSPFVCMSVQSTHRHQKSMNSCPAGQCYCAFACGPRDIKPDDTPFVDHKTGIYFCKERDRKEYNRPGNMCRRKGNACTA